MVGLRFLGRIQKMSKEFFPVFSTLQYRYYPKRNMKVPRHKAKLAGTPIPTGWQFGKLG